MLRYFLLAVILLSLSPIKAQIPPNTKVPFVAYWSMSEEHRFKVTKIKKRYKNGELTKNDSSSYIAQFRVVDSTEKGYKIMWSYKNSLTNIPQMTPELEEALDEYKELRLLYSTDEVGAFAGLDNWKEVAELTNKTVDVLLESVPSNNKEERKRKETAMKALTDGLSSKEGIESVLMKEIQYWHFPFGVEFDANTPIEYEDRLPNIIGGPPLKAKAKITFNEVDTSMYSCTFTQLMEIDQEDTKNMLLNVFKKMGLKDKEVKEALKASTYEINDVNTFSYKYFPGIPTKIECRRELQMNMMGSEGGNIEICRIEILDQD